MAISIPHIPFPNDLTVSVYIAHLQRVLKEYGDLVVVTSATDTDTHRYLGILDPPTVLTVEKDRDDESYRRSDDQKGNAMVCHIA